MSKKISLITASMVSASVAFMPAAFAGGQNDMGGGPPPPPPGQAQPSTNLTANVGSTNTLTNKAAANATNTTSVTDLAAAKSNATGGASSLNSRINAAGGAATGGTATGGIASSVTGPSSAAASNGAVTQGGNNTDVRLSTIVMPGAAQLPSTRLPDFSLGGGISCVVVDAHIDRSFNVQLAAFVAAVGGGATGKQIFHAETAIDCVTLLEAASVSVAAIQSPNGCRLAASQAALFHIPAIRSEYATPLGANNGSVVKYVDDVCGEVKVKQITYSHPPAPYLPKPPAKNCVSACPVAKLQR